jgi:hypothetical protein
LSWPSLPSLRAACAARFSVWHSTSITFASAIVDRLTTRSPRSRRSGDDQGQWSGGWCRRGREFATRWPASGRACCFGCRGVGSRIAFDGQRA